MRNRDKLKRWLDVKPRLTVMAAAVLAVADGLVLSGASGYLSALCMVALVTAVLLVCGLAARWKTGILLCLLAIGMYGMAYWRTGVKRDSRQIGRASCRVRVRGWVRRLVHRSDGDVNVYLYAYTFIPLAQAPESQIAALNLASSSAPATPLLLARVDDCAATAQIEASLSRHMCPAVELAGKLRRLPAAVYPWDFDLAGYYRRQQIEQMLVASAQQPPLILRETPNSSDSQDWIAIVRKRMVDLHESALGAKLGDLLSSMVIGDKAVKPDARVREQFRALGLSHLVAASGFNLTVVAAVAWWAVRFILRCTWAVGLWCLGCIALFCLLAGFSPSVERAALMCGILILCSNLGRSVYLPASIAAALMITLVIDPSALADAGLQLSYCATLCIVLAAGRMTKLMVNWLRAPNWLAETVAVVLAANTAVLPLQMLYFWQVGALSVVANALVSPLVAPITVLGFIASALAGFNNVALDWLARAIDWLNGWLLNIMMIIVNSLSACAWSVIHIAPPSTGAVVLYYLFLMVWIACLHSASDKGKLMPIAGSVLLAAATLLLFLRPPLSSPAAVVFRASLLVVLPHGEGLLIGNCRGASERKAMLLLNVRRLAVVPFSFGTMHNALPTWHGHSRVVQRQFDKARAVQSIGDLF